MRRVDLNYVLHMNDAHGVIDANRSSIFNVVNKKKSRFNIIFFWSLFYFYIGSAATVAHRSAPRRLNTNKLPPLAHSSENVLPVFGF